MKSPYKEFLSVEKADTPGIFVLILKTADNNWTQVCHMAEPIADRVRAVLPTPK